MTPTDWSHWTPQMRATLLFVIRDGQILLIRKKRGLGAGKINGPGGRLELGETPRECIIREAEEELMITPHDPEEMGVLHFQFVDGLSLHCVVYQATDFTGTPTETDEALPLWTPLEAIPYHEMWADDILWLPHLVGGRKFLAWFDFNDDAMLSQHVEVLAEDVQPSALSGVPGVPHQPTLAV
jgi:8-oxo-dGTP diphosphatase